MNTCSQLGVVNICSVNPHNCLWSPFSSCGNWVLPLAHRIHIQGPYSWPSQVIAVLCFPPTSHGPLGIPGNVLPASCCLSKALLKWHLRWEARLQSSTSECSRVNMAPYADLLLLLDGSLKSTVSSPREEGGWTLTSVTLFKFCTGPCSLLSTDWRNWSPDPNWQGPLWFLLSSEVVFRGRGSILPAFRRSLIS